jgi:hypothetical protein
MRYYTLFILLLSVSGLAHARHPASDRNRNQQVERTVAAESPRDRFPPCVASETSPFAVGTGTKFGRASAMVCKSNSPA